MTSVNGSQVGSNLDLNNLTIAEQEEMKKLGIINNNKEINSFVFPEYAKGRELVERHAVHAGSCLNEAYDYQKPSSFSRALSLSFGEYKVVLISGTASVDEHGASVHIGDFRAQCWRTFRNITELLNAEEMTWHDIVRTTCYLRDMSRDYEDFNTIRTTFYDWLKLDPLPASTGIQAVICREDLLVEIEAIAVSKK
jgi:enamine deaminase RidA (YjgF/YER057c/UK114 family)